MRANSHFCHQTADDVLAREQQPWIDRERPVRPLQRIVEPVLVPVGERHLQQHERRVGVVLERGLLHGQTAREIADGLEQLAVQYRLNMVGRQLRLG